jgi:molybdopterin/thiamine biosynthesis adenylyltransferase
VVGAGGLGCPAALYLAAAGVGRLTLADADKVDLTNLQRQILYRTDSVGAPKVEAARKTLGAINPEVEISTLQERVEDFSSLVARADVVLDCTDNFATRKAINRACARARRPLVSGAAIRFDGQVSVFDLRDAASPCYACVFPPTEDLEETRCATLGVFAPLVGIIGAMQAAEALKLLAGTGRSLAGRLQMLDGRSMEWTEVRVARQAGCPVCGTRGQEPPARPQADS